MTDASVMTPYYIIIDKLRIQFSDYIICLFMFINVEMHSSDKIRVPSAGIIDY
jgi:hypothetical protein